MSCRGAMALDVTRFSATGWVELGWVAGALYDNTTCNDRLLVRSNAVVEESSPKSRVLCSFDNPFRLAAKERKG